MGDRRREPLGHIWALAMVGLALSACGADPVPSAAPPPLDAVETPGGADPAGGATADEAGPAPATTGVDGRADGHLAPTAADVAPVARRPELDQPAIWPAADVVFATPEEAAADFVSAVLISEGDPELGDFQQGDARSGEIAVLFAGETGDLDPPLQKGVLALRRLGPTDGWYVIAANSDGVVIDTPSALDEVPASTVTVSGEGRGFEGTLAVSAFPPGDDGATYDLEIGAGGAFADLEPYGVELDLSGAAPGDVVVVLVHGDTGLGNDPSSFAAIPIVIASAPSATIPATR
jgi:hypothetical protein